jgi:hypothetical protein
MGKVLHNCSGQGRFEQQFCLLAPCVATKRLQSSLHMSVGSEKLARGESHDEVVDACLNKPVYRVLARAAEADELALKLQYSSLTFDAYCVGCKRSATFRRVAPRRPPDVPPSLSSPLGPPPPKDIVNLWQTVTAFCTRHASHTLTFFFGLYRGGIAKVGQCPSAMDLVGAQLDRFSDVLDEADIRELRQAVMLHTHGAAIGAFVYLRRIFERLLERHHVEYVNRFGPIADYEILSVEDRVQALKDVLPPEVVDNRKVYRILSRGIHKLHEDECAVLYDVMFPAITEVLEQDIYQEQQLRNSAELRKGVARAVETLNLDNERIEGD